MGIVPDDVGRKGDLAVQQLVEPIRYGLQGELLGVIGQRLGDIVRLGRRLLRLGQSGHSGLFFLIQTETLGENGMRFAHVGAEDDLGAVLQQVPDGGQRADDALVAGDLAVLHGDVEVAAHQYTLAGHVQIFDGLFVQVTHNSTSFLK